jgi:hypothetical protein
MPVISLCDVFSHTPYVGPSLSSMAKENDRSETTPYCCDVGDSIAVTMHALRTWRSCWNPPCDQPKSHRGHIWRRRRADPPAGREEAGPKHPIHIMHCHRCRNLSSEDSGDPFMLPLHPQQRDDSIVNSPSLPRQGGQVNPPSTTGNSPNPCR